MKTSIAVRYLLCAALLGAIGAGDAAPPATRPAVDPQADALLKKMSACLAGTKSFRFKVYALTEDVLDSGQKVEFAKNSTVCVTRPDRLDVTMAGDREDFHIVYDGKQVSVDNLRKKVYGQIPESGPIDNVLDDLAEKHGMIVPLTDLMESDPYRTLAPLIHSGEYLGTGYVFDVKCDHLAFRQESVDWQVWIDQGSQPLPRKIIITYKDSPARLQYVAYLNNWDLAPHFDDATFRFAPAADEKKIDALMPATQAAE